MIFFVIIQYDYNMIKFYKAVAACAWRCLPSLETSSSQSRLVENMTLVLVVIVFLRVYAVENTSTVPYVGTVNRVTTLKCLKHFITVRIWTQGFDHQKL
jgi:hypothetical protein